MGYPMTWRRLVNRNGLGDGDYTKPPERHRAGVPLDDHTGTIASREETALARFPHVAERCERYEKAFMMLAGDLRRLEHDIVDESALCLAIARRTGLDADVIAAVLKEFVSE